jgi:tetratricopeptide (TPR) repeat protein
MSLNTNGPVLPAKPAGQTSEADWRWAAAVSVGLVAMVLAVFGQTVTYGFVNFDDDLYVYKNPLVSQGLSLAGTGWAFTQVECHFWHPLTMLSLMLDDTLYGLNAGGYHLTNLLLHAASAVVLFLALRRVTGAHWRSAFVAAVFAVHPLHVESVAWVAERKDVLSGLFFMLTLWAYAHYVREPRSWGRYLAVVGLFALGLMAKPVLVTLPFVLLLLDYWPLGRFKPGPDGGAAGIFPAARRLVVEKIPLFVLAAGAGVATVFAEGTTVVPLGQVSFLARVGNALISYVTYVGQFFFPTGLTVFYPYADDLLAPWKAGAALALLAGISAAAYVLRLRHGYFWVGWCWYAGMLVPMIGLVQVGAFRHADRFTYLPLIGLGIAVTWGVAEWSAGWPKRRLILGSLMIVALASLTVGAERQVSYWKDSETLWRHTLAVNADNAIAEYSLGIALANAGATDEAMRHWETALTINPRYFDAENSLASVLLESGAVDEALVHVRRALAVDPHSLEAEDNLAYALLQKGQPDAAAALLRQVLSIDPDRAEPHNHLGDVLLGQGEFAQAQAQFQAALALQPDFAEAHFNLGRVLWEKGQAAPAQAQFEETLKLKPNDAEAHDYLGNALLQAGRTEAAAVQFQKAVELQPDDADAQNLLGATLLQTGQTAEAIRHWQTAVQLQPDNVQTLNNLAWVLATGPQAALRNGGQSVTLAQHANELTGRANPSILRTLAAAYAEAGNFPAAVQAAQTAAQLAAAQNNTDLAKALLSQSKLYEAGTPLRDGSIR